MSKPQRLVVILMTIFGLLGGSCGNIQISALSPLMTQTQVSRSADICYKKGNLQLIVDPQNGRFELSDANGITWMATPESQKMTTWKAVARTKVASLLSVTLIQLETQREITVQGQTAALSGHVTVVPQNDGFDITYLFEDTVEVTLK